MMQLKWILLLACLPLGLAGCAKVTTCAPALHPHGHEQQVKVSIVGRFRQPGEFVLTNQPRATLRDAVIRAGGLDQPEAVGNWVQVPMRQASQTSSQPQTQTQIQSNSDSSTSAGGNTLQSDKQLVDATATLKAQLNDEERMSKLFGLGEDSFRIFEPIPGDTLLTLLQQTSDSMAFWFVGVTGFQYEILKDYTNDPIELIDDLKKAIEFKREADPEYADLLLSSLDNIKSQLNKAGLPQSPTAVGQTSRTPVAGNKMPEVATLVSAGEIAQPAPMFVGIVRAKAPDEKLLFLAPLVFSTSIGELTVEQGDLIFAVSLNETSLPHTVRPQVDFAIPTTGIANMTHLDSASYSRIGEAARFVESLWPVATVSNSDEGVMVISRKQATSKSTEVFHIPVGADWQGAREIQQHWLSPSDQLHVAPVSHTRVVVRDILNRTRQEVRAQRAAVRQELQDQRLPWQGRLVDQASANLRRGMRTVSALAPGL